MKYTIEFTKVNVCDVETKVPHDHCGMWKVQGVIGKTQISGETSMPVYRGLDLPEKFECRSTAEFLSYVRRAGGGKLTRAQMQLLAYEFRKVAVEWLRGNVQSRVLVQGA